jgi:hypothetical protein
MTTKRLPSMMHPLTEYNPRRAKGGSTKTAGGKIRARGPWTACWRECRSLRSTFTLGRSRHAILPDDDAQRAYYLCSHAPDDRIHAIWPLERVAHAQSTKLIWLTPNSSRMTLVRARRRSAGRRRHRLPPQSNVVLMVECPSRATFGWTPANNSGVVWPYRVVEASTEVAFKSYTRACSASRHGFRERR